VRSWWKKPTVLLVSLLKLSGCSVVTQERSSFSSTAPMGTGSLTSRHHASSVDAWAVFSNKQDMVAISSTFDRDWVGAAK